MIDFFANRHNDSALKQTLTLIPTFIDFCQYYNCYKGKLIKRKNPENLIILTIPRIQFNKNNIENHKKYCYFELMKYGNWTIENLSNITLDNSIELYDEFIHNADEKILNKIRYYLLKSKS